MLSAKSYKAIFLLPFNMLISIPAILVYCFETFQICNNVVNCCFAIPLFLIGSYLLLKTILLFDKNGNGTLAPWYPTKKLVIEGPYRHVRNPMISGVIIILFSEGLIFSAKSIFILAAIFFIINTIYFLIKEERDLEKRFGKEYLEYKKQVPMWLPRMKAYKSNWNS